MSDAPSWSLLIRSSHSWRTLPTVDRLMQLRGLLNYCCSALELTPKRDAKEAGKAELRLTCTWCEQDHRLMPLHAEAAHADLTPTCQLTSIDLVSLSVCLMLLRRALMPGRKP